MQIKETMVYLTEGFKTSRIGCREIRRSPDSVHAE